MRECVCLSVCVCVCSLCIVTPKQAAAQQQGKENNLSGILPCFGFGFGFGCDCDFGFDCDCGCVALRQIFSCCYVLTDLRYVTLRAHTHTHTHFGKARRCTALHCDANSDANDLSNDAVIARAALRCAAPCCASRRRRVAPSCPRFFRRCCLPSLCVCMNVCLCVCLCVRCCCYV